MKRFSKKLIIGEFPVIHKGYARFLNFLAKKKRKNSFFIAFLGKDLIKEMTELEEDIRAISAADKKKIIAGYMPGVFLTLKKNSFQKQISRINPDKIYILKGEKSEIFAKSYLKNEFLQKAEFFDIRLCWKEGRVKSFKRGKSELPEKEILRHRKFLEKALKQAQNSKCWWRQVGAVLVKDGKVILEAFNQMLPSYEECYKVGCVRDNIKPGKDPEICSAMHAEAAIIAMAAEKGLSLKGATIYLSHFPCPACARLIALSGIGTLVYQKGSSVFDGERLMRSRKVKIIKI